jgi:hypothetical protein
MDGKVALGLFYIFFWTSELNTTMRYQPFDTPSMWKKDCKATLRFFVSLLILNIFPIVLFLILYSYVIPDGKMDCKTIFASAVVSLSVFGFHRILHALIASDQFWRYFYTNKQIRFVRDRGPLGQTQNYLAHLIPGLFYIVFWPALGWVVINYCWLVLWLQQEWKLI